MLNTIKEYEVLLCRELSAFNRIKWYTHHPQRKATNENE